MKHALMSLILMLGLAASAPAAEDGWVSLFDGKTLTGWTQRNGTASYKVEDGTIVGRTAKGSPNSFLCTDKDYADFELELDVKVDNGLNSGVQLRSRERGEKDVVGGGKKKNDAAGRVFGPQVEIASGGEKGSMSGYIYGEAMGAWRTPQERLKPHSHFKNNEWNHFRIVAKGERIQVWINGQQIEDLKDEEIFKSHPKGFIGLQVHGIGNKEVPKPLEVAWKNIRIRELK